MKNILLKIKHLSAILLCISSVHLFAQDGLLIRGEPQKIVLKNNWSTYELKGKVKKYVDYEVWQMENNSGILVDRDKKKGSLSFNERGYLIGKKEFKSNGGVRCIDSYVYKDDKKVADLFILYEDDTVAMKHIGKFAYNDDGLCIDYTFKFKPDKVLNYCSKREEISKKEVIFSTSVNEYSDKIHEFYDEHGFLDSLYATQDLEAPSKLSAKFYRDNRGVLLKTIAERSSLAKGNELDGHSEITYSYHDNARLKNYQWFRNGVLNKIVEFDSEGNLLSIFIFKNNTLYMKEEYSYTFDSHKNWIKKQSVTTYLQSKDFNKERKVIFNYKREIAYYE